MEKKYLSEISPTDRQFFLLYIFDNMFNKK